MYKMILEKICRKMNKCCLFIITNKNRPVSHQPAANIAFYARQI